jgi:hypothetical protein
VPAKHRPAPVPTERGGAPSRPASPTPGGSDGSDAVGTVTFSLDNREYEIDLSDENTDMLHEALAPSLSTVVRPVDVRVGGAAPGGRGR